MTLINRLFFAFAACLLLSNCGLINTALRLAPLLMLADEGRETGSGTSLEMRAGQVQARGTHGGRPQPGSPGSGLAFSR